MNHQQAQALLPWLANQTLDDGDSEALARHAQGCAQCAADLELLDAVCHVSAETGPDEPAFRPQLIDGVMAQLAHTPQVPVQQRTHSLGTTVARLVAATRTWLAEQLAWQAAPWPLRTALVAQCAMIAVLAGVLLFGSDDAAIAPGAEQTYETVSGAAQGDLAIAFRPGASEGDIRAILVELNAQIVAGPSAVGIYRLELGQGPAVSAALEQLAASDLVIYLELVPQP